MITLQPITMIVPNAMGIYAISRLRKSKLITHQEFLQKFANSARTILVSFDDDGIGNPQLVEAYANGLDCWYIMVPIKEEKE